MSEVKSIFNDLQNEEAKNECQTLVELSKDLIKLNALQVKFISII